MRLSRRSSIEQKIVHNSLNVCKWLELVLPFFIAIKAFIRLLGLCRVGIDAETNTISLTSLYIRRLNVCYDVG